MGAPSASGSKDEKAMPPASLSPEPSVDSPGKMPQPEWAGGSETETEPKPEEEKTEEGSKASVPAAGGGSSASLQEMRAELYRLVRETHKVG